MQLTQAQKTIAKDNHRFRVLNCGRRFGKTTLAVEEIKGLALAKEARIAYIAPTYQQARDIAWGMLVKELKPIIKKINETRLELEVLNKDGLSSFIVLRGWESVETMRGQAFDFLILDEVASMRNFWVGWNEVLSPTLIDRKGNAMFISTPKGFNHFYDLFNLREKDTDFASFHYTTYDNPTVPPEEIEREKKAKPEDTFAQEYLADFRKQEGLVYKEFDRSKHLFDDFTQRRQIAEVLAGVDFGFTNPSVILRIEHDTDNHYWITSEWYKTQQTNAQLIEYAKTLSVNIFYPDPAEPDRIKEMSDAGLNIREVSKDIEKGIDSVRELLKQDRLHIHKDCINLINELETYRYPDKKPEHNEPEVPVKENDHAMDAMRYALHNNMPAYIEHEESFSLYSHTYS